MEKYDLILRNVSFGTGEKEFIAINIKGPIPQVGHMIPTLGMREYIKEYLKSKNAVVNDFIGKYRVIEVEHIPQGNKDLETTVQVTALKI